MVVEFEFHSSRAAEGEDGPELGGVVVHQHGDAGGVHDEAGADGVKDAVGGGGTGVAVGGGGNPAGAGLSSAPATKLGSLVLLSITAAKVKRSPPYSRWRRFCSSSDESR